MESLHPQEHAPISPERFAAVSELHDAVCGDREPHGAHAHLIDELFAGTHEDAMNESRGIEGNPARLEALRKLWTSMLESRQMPEA